MKNYKNPNLGASPRLSFAQARLRLVGGLRPRMGKAHWAYFVGLGPLAHPRLSFAQCWGLKALALRAKLGFAQVALRAR